MAGDFQTELDGACVQDEVFGIGRLPFPAQPADPTVFEAAGPPLDRGRFLLLALRHCLDCRIGYRIKQTDSEERRWVALRPRDYERAHGQRRLPDSGIA